MRDLSMCRREGKGLVEHKGRVVGIRSLDLLKDGSFVVMVGRAVWRVRKTSGRKGGEVWRTYEMDLFCGDSASPVYDRRPTEKDLEDAPAFPREPWEMVPVEESAKRPEYVERMKKVLRELTLSGVNDVDLPKYERAIIAVNRERYDRR